ncbi:MAG: DNA primase [Deltaproteobacteria bacterium RIFCSPLOWO2_02_FULL_53_8]|nr:MAG: DNA primase [Deltaproteobacteria bacterium RIFCSPLOWO2_02_FULL_53_8]
MIPKEKIEEVKDRADIVDVISSYVPLKKRGNNHIGLCPFHTEKSPSFSVSADKRMFYCFGCRETGSVIDFLMKKDGLDFVEAVRSLAARYGIIIEETSGKATDEREGLYEVLKAAAYFYQSHLESGTGAGARLYLNKRGYAGDILTDFAVGYAPRDWDGLLLWLKKRGIDPETASKAGLIIKKEKGGWYDRFRDRVIFPIHDLRGRVVAFGGRAMEGGEPKYLNSPESAVFKKGSILYGLYQAKQSMMKEDAAIVVEGYFDLLAMHRHGFKNSVATMGTALTSEHLRLLKARAATVYTLFDSDEAGKAAALRGLDLFIAEELTCRMVALETAKDPDEFLLKSGPAAMKAAISGAEPLMEFFLKNLRTVTDVTAPEGKARYLDLALPYLLKIRNVAERGHYAATAAATLGIPVDAVYEAMKTPHGGSGFHASLPSPVKAKSAGLKEVTLIRVILKHPELYDARFDAAIGAFGHEALRDAAAVIAQFCREGRSLTASSVLDALPEGCDRSVVAEVLFRDDDGFVESPVQMLEDSLKSIMVGGKLKEKTVELLKRLEESGNKEFAEEIMRRLKPDAEAKK